MEEKKSDTKILWYILFIVITVVLCYFFAVVYFFYINPYDISAKTTIWPFMSDNSVGQLYLDSTVEIKIKTIDEEFGDETYKSIVGVNVRKDGYILAPYDELKDSVSQSEIKILSNSGQVFNGKILFGDMNYNLAILKCEPLDNTSKVKFPFASLEKITDKYYFDDEVIAVSLPLNEKIVSTCPTTDYNCVIGLQGEVQGEVAIDYVLEYCFTIQDNLQNPLKNSAIFDKSGGLMGFVCGATDNECVVMQVECAIPILDKVVENYEENQMYSNTLVSSLVGFDLYDLSVFISASELNEDQTKFYFQDAWHDFTEDILTFRQASEGFYLMEDFSYKDAAIPAGNVLKSIFVNEKSISPNCRVDIVNAFYKLKKDDFVTIYYEPVDASGQKLKTVSFIF